MKIIAEVEASLGVFRKQLRELQGRVENDLCEPGLLRHVDELETFILYQEELVEMAKMIAAVNPDAARALEGRLGTMRFH